MLFFHSLDERACSADYSVCKDDCTGSDHKRLFKECCRSIPTASCQGCDTKRVSGKFILTKRVCCMLRFVWHLTSLTCVFFSQRWCPVMVDWLCTSIGISIAWKIQTIISAFTSALAGGLIMARALMLIVSKGKKDHEDTSADEIASYVFAGLGFYFQYMLKFDVPFPLNLFLWPMELAEYYIRWAVTDAAGG